MISDSEIISVLRTDMPARCTVSGSPETNGCHQSKFLPSRTVRYPQVLGSQCNAFKPSGVILLQPSSISNRRLYIMQLHELGSRCLQAMRVNCTFPSAWSWILFRQHIPHRQQSDSHSVFVKLWRDLSIHNRLF